MWYLLALVPIAAAVVGLTRRSKGGSVSASERPRNSHGKRSSHPPHSKGGFNPLKVVGQWLRKGRANLSAADASDAHSAQPRASLYEARQERRVDIITHSQLADEGSPRVPPVQHAMHTYDGTGTALYEHGQGAPRADVVEHTQLANEASLKAPVQDVLRPDNNKGSAQSSNTLLTPGSSQSSVFEPLVSGTSAAKRFELERQQLSQALQEARDTHLACAERQTAAEQQAMKQATALAQTRQQLQELRGQLLHRPERPQARGDPCPCKSVGASAVGSGSIGDEGVGGDSGSSSGGSGSNTVRRNDTSRGGETGIRRFPLQDFVAAASADLKRAQDAWFNGSSVATLFPLESWQSMSHVVREASSHASDSIVTGGGPTIPPQLFPPLATLLVLLPILRLCQCCKRPRSANQAAKRISAMSLRERKSMAAHHLVAIYQSTRHSRLLNALHAWTGATWKQASTTAMAAHRLVTIYESTRHFRLVGALHAWTGATWKRAHTTLLSTRRLQKCLAQAHAMCLARAFSHWHVLAVGLQSALEQHRKQQLALIQVIKQYERGEHREKPPSRSRSMVGDRYGASSPRPSVFSVDRRSVGDAAAELSGSIRQLGSNVMRLVREQSVDAKTVAKAPRRLLSATRHLVPRLAEHVSPTRLLTSMVKEVNESITASASMTTLSTMGDGASPDASAHATYHSAYAHESNHTYSSRAFPDPSQADPVYMDHAYSELAYSDVYSDQHLPEVDERHDCYERHERADRVIRPPTEEALRAHNQAALRAQNEGQASDAAAAAAAVLSRLSIERVDGNGATTM